MSRKEIADSAEASALEAPGSHSVDESVPELSPEMSRLVQGIQNMEEWYAAKFKERVTEITELLRQEITQEIRGHFDSELKSNLESARAQFDERLFNAASQWSAERQLLSKEIEKLRILCNSDVIQEEIERVEREIQSNELELERMINDPSVALSEPMKIKAKQVDLKAYWSGLRFGIDNAAAMPLVKPA